MDGSHTRRFFLEPQQTFQRQYEALRALFVDDEPLERVAERFDYTSFRQLHLGFRRNSFGDGPGIVTEPLSWCHATTISPLNPR